MEDNNNDTPRFSCWFDDNDENNTSKLSSRFEISLPDYYDASKCENCQVLRKQLRKMNRQNSALIDDCYKMREDKMREFKSDKKFNPLQHDEKSPQQPKEID